MKSLESHIEYFLTCFSKDDFEIVSEILCWDESKKFGFMAAKRIFEQEQNDERKRKLKKSNRAREEICESSEDRRRRRDEARAIGEGG